MGLGSCHFEYLLGREIDITGPGLEGSGQNESSQKDSQADNPALRTQTPPR
jgi:hypothetical protein